MVSVFFQQLLKVVELHPILSKLVWDILESRVSVDEEF